MRPGRAPAPLDWGMTRSRLCSVATALLLAPLGACSMSPTYEVRVVNESSVTVVATIANTRNIARNETLAQATVRAKREVTLGPVVGVPLDPIELQISLPEDMQLLSERTRLTRGVWTATISDTSGDSWSRYAVRVVKGRGDDAPLAGPGE